MDKQRWSQGLFRAILVWGVADIYFILSVITAVLFGILSPDVQKQLNLDSAQIGLLGSIFFLSYGIAQLVAGSLIDSLGPRLTLAGSSLIATAGLFLLSAAGDIKLAIPAQLLIGAGLSTSYVGAIYLAGTWFPPERFSLVSGITQMSANIMTALVVLIMAISGAIVSFRIVTKTMGIAILAIGVLMFLFVQSASKLNNKSGGEGQKSGFIANIHKLLVIPQFWMGTIYFSAGFGVLLAFSNLWNIPDQLAYGHTIEYAAVMNAMLPLGGAFGAIVAGWVSDHLGRKSVVAKFYITGMLVLAAVLVYGPTFPTAVALLLLVILGFFFGGAVLGFPLVGQHVPTALQGSAFGLMATIAYLVSAFLQYLVGALLGQTPTPGTAAAISDFKLALTPFVIVLLIGFVCSRWLKDSENAS